MDDCGVTMATEPIEQNETAPRELLRPAVIGGTGHVESLGRWIDDLMGHAKIQRQVRHDMEEFRRMLNGASEGCPQEGPAPLPDPPLIATPKPVPGGMGTEEKGNTAPPESEAFRPSRRSP